MPARWMLVLFTVAPGCHPDPPPSGYAAPDVGDPLEPTWWFARLGQHAHEGLSLITLAQLDCGLALQSHRNLLERVEDDGYLPYNVGPVVTTDTLGTATAPLLSYVSWELAQACDDPDFLADAYDAGSRVHDFWVEQRDRDGDGLAEFGGFAVSDCRVGSAGCPAEPLTRTGQGDFHHPAPPRIRLTWRWPRVTWSPWVVGAGGPAAGR